MKKNGKICIFFNLFICFFGIFIYSCTSKQQQEQPRIKQKLSVITLNIYAGNDKLSAVSDLIFKYNPDIVCLQETMDNSQKFLIKTLSKTYPYYAAHLSKIANGPLTLSKYPIQNGKYHLSPVGINGYWIGELIVNNGVIQIANLHLHPTFIKSKNPLKCLSEFRDAESIRLREIEDLYSHLKQNIPTIVVGDFNTTSKRSAAKYMKQKGFSDSFASVNKKPDKTPTIINKSIPIFSEFRIDYIFHTSHFTTIESKVIKEGNSDHFAVKSDLGLKE